MFVKGALINPVIVAPLMTVVSVRTKSSAVSVSSFPVLSLRESAANRPSELPAAKKKGSAQAGVVSHAPAVNSAAVKLTRNLMSLLLVDALVLNHQLHSSSHRLRIRRGPCLQRLTIDIPDHHGFPFESP